LTSADLPGAPARKSSSERAASSVLKTDLFVRFSVAVPEVLANARAADNDGTTASDALRRFIEAAITQRNELVLPLHGGPPVTSPETLAVAPRDVVVFGAMLAQPRPSEPEWDATCLLCSPPT
jgi:hypothetical protein